MPWAVPRRALRQFDVGFDLEESRKTGIIPRVRSRNAPFVVITVRFEAAPHS
jgi:hypothetical protein